MSKTSTTIWEATESSLTKENRLQVVLSRQPLSPTATEEHQTALGQIRAAFEVGADCQRCAALKSQLQQARKDMATVELQIHAAKESVDHSLAGGKDLTEQEIMLDQVRTRQGHLQNRLERLPVALDAAQRQTEHSWDQTYQAAVAALVR